MKVSILITFLTVAGKPALCDKEAHTTTSGTYLGWTPQQTTEAAMAEESYISSKLNSSEGRSFMMDLYKKVLNMPEKSAERLLGLLNPTKTDSAVLAQISSAIAEFPPADQSFFLKLQSGARALGESISKSFEAIPTSTGVLINRGCDLHGVSMFRPTITPAPHFSVIAEKAKRYLDPGTWSPSQSSAIDRAVMQLDKSLGSKYASVLTRLDTETVDYVDRISLEGLKAQMTLGAADLDARVSSFIDMFPTYAQQWKKEQVAGVLSIFSSVLNPASAIQPRDTASQSASRTIMDMFTHPSVTPEQSDALDANFEEYDRSVENSPEFSSVFGRMSSEKFELDESAFGKVAMQTASGSPAYVARFSSAIDLFPTYARSFLSSVEFAQLSIWSGVLNSPAKTDVTSLGGTLSTLTSLPIQSIALFTMVGKDNKDPKKDGTITSPDVLPMETMKLTYPNYVDWSAEQSSAMEEGASSLLSSLLANSKDWSKLTDAMTASGWSEMQPYIGTAATDQYTNIQDLKGALAQVPPAASKVVSKFIMEEISLFSKVDNMESRTTMQTKIKSKRQDIYPSCETSGCDKFAISFAQYSTERSYDESMVTQPNYSSLLAKMSVTVYDCMEKWRNSCMELDGPIQPEFPYSPDAYSSLTSELGDMVTTMPPDVQDFFRSVANDEASIKSIVSAAFATNATTSEKKKVAVTSKPAIVLETVTEVVPANPTGKQSSASKEILSSGVLAVGLVVIMALL